MIRGIVQGVLFRASMRDVARANRVDGWVRNRPDGAVEALLEGEEIDVKRVLDWSERGPSRARVDSVTEMFTVPWSGLVTPLTLNSTEYSPSERSAGGLIRTWNSRASPAASGGARQSRCA